MSAHERPPIGSVFERTAPRAPTAPSSRFTGTSGTGFPVAQHRSRSAFARARDEANRKGNLGGPKSADVPSIISERKQKSNTPSSPTLPIVDPMPIPSDAEALRQQIHEENARLIARMSEEEIEKEKHTVLDQLGEGTKQLLRRVQEARRRRELKEKEAQVTAQIETKDAREVQGKGKDMLNGDDTRHTTEREHEREHVAVVASPTPRRASDGLASKPGILRVKSLENLGRSAPSPLPATSSTRPSSRTGRKLRFAEVTPDDVHVYESAPVSPKRTILALPPPPSTKDDSIMSLSTFHKNAIPSKRPHPTDSPTESQPIRFIQGKKEPEEGTPEYIRRRYFPDLPANDPNLSWMEAPSAEMADPSIPRFDLHGAPISASLSASLPSNLGLHHHAEGSHAGYTIDDIFLLARSTVPAQRASMLGILAKITHRLGWQLRYPDSPDKVIAFTGQESKLRKRILAAGLAALDQIGSVGARAVEVVWECLVEWDGATRDLEDVELALAPDVISSLQLDYLLPQITEVLIQSVLPTESLAQLLFVVHWLAQQSNHVANLITTTPRLIPTILDTFLLTPIPPKEDSIPPNPLALQLFITLASASRSNALALLDPTDALLRFVTILPPSSPYSPALATTLLTDTLRLYTTLASYGFYSHIATTASSIFTTLASFTFTTDVFNPASRQLRIAWTSLVEAWTVCATDPHATSPPHEILWSQVCVWGWAKDIRKFREGLGNERLDWKLYSAMWDVEAAWLEGARINGIKGGEDEREDVLLLLRSTFSADDGVEFGIVRQALEGLQRELGEGSPSTSHSGERVLKSIAGAGNVLASALRLWLACLPTLSGGASLCAPPFALPLSDLSALSAALVKHPIWSLPLTLKAPHLRIYLRPLTRFFIYFHRVSRYIPGTTPQLWLAQALVFLSRLLPGDESDAFVMLDSFLLVTPQLVGFDPAALPDIHMDPLRPFFEYTVRPNMDVYVSPLHPTTESISRSSTLRLFTSSPSHPDPVSGGGDNINSSGAGLPLTRDFLFSPLTHLLRSGTSPVFRNLPADWTAGEVDVVRATLLLVYATRGVLLVHGLDEFVHNAAEIVFACMRVCMLEHGVGEGGTELEVYRDAGVERLMTWLLEPFTVRTGGGGLHLAKTLPTRSLEDASATYLGSTPFYQFYTDMVALYGAVSFGHKTFATLVVAPLAMCYAVDYRRALWCGGDGAGSASTSGAGSGRGHAGLADVVRSVRLPLEDVVCTTSGDGDPREYLYPIEQDIGVLGVYVAALLARDGEVEGFLRFVAVHHVACTIWGDLDDDADERETTEEEAEVTRREETRARLLKVVLVRCEANTVREVVLYRQRSRAQGACLWPPMCYSGEDVESGGAWREARQNFVRHVMGEGAAERVRALLISAS